MASNSGNGYRLSEVQNVGLSRCRCSRKGKKSWTRLEWFGKPNKILIIDILRHFMLLWFKLSRISIKPVIRSNRCAVACPTVLPSPVSHGSMYRCIPVSTICAKKYHLFNMSDIFLRRFWNWKWCENLNKKIRGIWNCFPRIFILCILYRILWNVSWRGVNFHFITLSSSLPRFFLFIVLLILSLLLFCRLVSLLLRFAAPLLIVPMATPFWTSLSCSDFLNWDW